MSLWTTCAPSTRTSPLLEIVRSSSWKVSAEARWTTPVVVNRPGTMW